MTGPAFRECHPVPRLTDPSPDELQERFFDPGFPCVIAEFHRSADLLEWMRGIETCESIVPCVVARSLNVSKISDEDRPPVGRAPQHPEIGEFSAELPLAEAWGRMNRPAAYEPLLVRGECVYVIEGLVPPGYPFPGRIPDTALAARLFADQRTPMVIVNMPGMINRNHTHVHEVLLHQVHHRKRVRLFSPADTPHLYMNADRRSEVPDFDQVDLARFPRVAEAVAHEAVLEPGDVLFLPSYWWHEIRVDEPAVSVGFTVEMGTWARSTFAFHHALGRALEEIVAADDASGRGSGVASIVTATVAASLERQGPEPTIAGLHYEYS